MKLNGLNYAESIGFSDNSADIIYKAFSSPIEPSYQRTISYEIVKSFRLFYYLIIDLSFT